MAPFDLARLSGSFTYYLIFLAIGVGFGATLEMAGFGDSRKLAAQFYLKDMTVLKVMFTGIIVAATLIFLSSALGLLDVDRVWVNPTYLWPGIVGGLIMGVGFIVGGFCPGTSVVAASTLKLDGILFVGGVGTGVWLFGESVGSFPEFFNSSFMGRFTLADWLGIPLGVALLLLVLMALVMFFGAELSERFFGRGERWGQLKVERADKWTLAGAAALLAIASAVAIKGQPTLEQRWARLAPQETPRLAQRDVYVHPAEVAGFMNNATVTVAVIDVRAEQDYNLFHLAGARRVDPGQVASPELLRQLKQASDGTLFFLIGHGEQTATEAYKTLRGAGLLNVYVVEGGINHWLDVFGIDPCVATPLPKGQRGAEELRYAFTRAVGERIDAAHPGCPCKEAPVECEGQEHKLAAEHEPGGAKPQYTPKVKLQKKAKTRGGCG